MMVFRICKRGCEWREIAFPDCDCAAWWVIHHMHELQTFSVPETGNVFGYAVELSDSGKPVQILYHHEIDGELIWVRCL